MVAAEFAMRLGQHVRKHGLGRTFAAETGFLLARNPDTVLAPDASFVRADRMVSVCAEGYFPGAPDFAVEVRSPDDSERELAAKAQRWLAFGCRMVVTVDPETHSAIAYQHGAPPVPVPEHGTIDANEVVHGFTLRLDELFTG